MTNPIDELTIEHLPALLRAFILTEYGFEKIFQAAMRDEQLAIVLCELAGILAACNSTHKTLIEDRIKSLRRRSGLGLAASLGVYVGALEVTDERTARKTLRKFEERRTGKKITDKTIQNMLSEAANTIPLDDFPDNLRALIEKRLEHGVKTRHRGN